MQETKEDKKQALRRATSGDKAHQKKIIAQRMNRTVRTIDRWANPATESWPKGGDEEALLELVDTLHAGSNPASFRSDYEILEHAHKREGLRTPRTATLIPAVARDAQYTDLGNVGTYHHDAHKNVPIISDNRNRQLPALPTLTDKDLQDAPQVPVSKTVLRLAHRPALLPVTGDSMHPDFPEGSLALIDLQPRPTAELLNRFCVMWFQDEGPTLKTLREDESATHWLLVPTNDSYRIRVVTKNMFAAVDKSFAVFGCLSIANNSRP